MQRAGLVERTERLWALSEAGIAVREAIWQETMHDLIAATSGLRGELYRTDPTSAVLPHLDEALRLLGTV